MWRELRTIVLGAAIGFCLAVNLLTDPVRQKPKSLSSEETKLGAVVIPPTRVIVDFVPRESREFQEVNLLAPYGVNGFAQITENPCRIVVPSGSKIDFNGPTGEAWWSSYDFGMTLAHEILHCVGGHWHGSVDEIIAARRKREEDVVYYTRAYLFRIELRAKQEAYE